MVPVCPESNEITCNDQLHNRKAIIACITLDMETMAWYLVASWVILWEIRASELLSSKACPLVLIVSITDCCDRMAWWEDCNNTQILLINKDDIPITESNTKTPMKSLLWKSCIQPFYLLQITWFINIHISDNRYRHMVSKTSLSPLVLSYKCPTGGDPYNNKRLVLITKFTLVEVQQRAR